MSREDERIRFTFRMPEELLEKLKVRADKLGVSVNALILQILWEWVKNEDDDKKTA